MEHEVALVDDHHLMRNGLAAMVNGLGGFQVTLEAGNGREFIQALSGTQHPAIAIVDLNMPVMDGYDTIAWVRKHAPKILCLALTFDATDNALVRAVRAGARGFLLKNTRPATLKTALNALLATGYYYTDAMSESLRQVSEGTDPEHEREAVLAQITPREMEFLLHVCSATEPTYEQIAEAMGVHRRTVDNFRISLFAKFNIKSKVGLVLFALRWGLVAGG